MLPLGTIFFNSDIIERQHIAGTEAPLFQVSETERNLSDGELEITSTTTQKTYTVVKFKRIGRETICNVFVGLLNVTCRYLPYVGTGRLLLTSKIRNI